MQIFSAKQKGKAQQRRLTDELFAHACVEVERTGHGVEQLADLAGRDTAGDRSLVTSIRDAVHKDRWSKVKICSAVCNTSGSDSTWDHIQFLTSIESIFTIMSWTVQARACQPKSPILDLVQRHMNKEDDLNLCKHLETPWKYRAAFSMLLVTCMLAESMRTVSNDLLHSHICVVSMRIM